MSMCSSNWSALAGLALVGCGAGPSESELRALIDARVAEALARSESIEAGGAASIDAGGESDAGAAEDIHAEPENLKLSVALRASATFLDRADELMRDFKPEISKPEPHADLLRCITSQTAKQDVALSKGAERLRSIDQANQQGFHKELLRFQDRLFLHYRIDPDWAERKEKGDKLFLYSGTETAEKPALMRLLDQAKIAIPERLSCLVDDYSRVQNEWLIKCSFPRRLEFSVRGDPPDLRATDEVSLPLAGTSVDPAVLLKRGFSRYGRGERTWVVNGYAVALNVVPATCPSASDLFDAVESGGTP